MNSPQPISPDVTGSETSGAENVSITLPPGRRTLQLTNLRKIFFPAHAITKRQLINYYSDISAALLPHLKNRAMVMKRYPNGISGKFFFMKRTPEHRPEWIETCPILHASGSLIHFPMAQDLPSLLWLINLGCIDLNPWYATCDDTNLPDYMHFDLDPVEPAKFAQVRAAALLLRDYLDSLKLTSYPKTSGSRGMHIYVPIRRGLKQKQVWTIAKRLSIEVAAMHPDVLTSEYRIKNRPSGRVLVDYNQNAWGRTLASVYSVRPTPDATVSTPVTWEEVESGCENRDFTLLNVPRRVEKHGDLFAPILAKKGRCDLERFL
jgi:bifunctional non-homologous end joining protein LigD